MQETNLFVDVLSAIAALDSALDHRVAAEGFVDTSEAVEGQAEADEVDCLVKKHAVCMYMSVIEQSRRICR